MEIKTIGTKITEARKKNQISQAQLAEQLFISPQAVGKWERGESLPDILTFNRMAKILGVDLNYFSEDFAAIPKIQEIQHDENPVKKDEKLNWDMSKGNWSGADFSGLKNLHEKFSSSNMQNCKFVGSELIGLQLKNNNVGKCDFTASDFSGSQIINSNLSSNQFCNCNLKDVRFSASHISSCNLSGADFTGTIVKYGGFEKSVITNAVWKRTSFLGSYLAELEFTGKIDDCYFEDCAFSKVSFVNAELRNTFFKCRSLKKLKFSDCTADRMTYEFLKNGKADLSGLRLIENE